MRQFLRYIRLAEDGKSPLENLILRASTATGMIAVVKIVLAGGYGAIDILSYSDFMTIPPSPETQAGIQISPPYGKEQKRCTFFSGYGMTGID